MSDSGLTMQKESTPLSSSPRKDIRCSPSTSPRSGAWFPMHEPASPKRELISISDDCKSTDGFGYPTFSDLPTEVQLHILSFAHSPKELYNAALVCKQWQTWTTSDALWRSFAVKKWGVQIDAPRKEPTWMEFVRVTLGVLDKLHAIEIARCAKGKRKHYPFTSHLCVHIPV